MPDREATLLADKDTVLREKMERVHDGSKYADCEGGCKIHRCRKGSDSELCSRR